MLEKIDIYIPLFDLETNYTMHKLFSLLATIPEGKK